MGGPRGVEKNERKEDNGIFVVLPISCQKSVSEVPSIGEGGGGFVQI